MKFLIQFKNICILFCFVLALIAGCAGTNKQESTGEYIDDSVITGKVKTELFKQEGLVSLDISVKTFKGTVQLSGFVDNEQQREQAESVVRVVPGVVDVKNSLIVK